MFKFAGFILVLVVLSRCSGKENSAFDEILEKPPYAALTDSIKKEPGRDELYFRRAVLLNKDDLAQPALEDFRKAWSIRKEERYAFGISSILLEKNPDSSIQFLNGALVQLPESILLRINKARSWLAMEKTDEALAVCNEILQKNPEQVDVLKMKAELLQKKGDTNEAIRTLELAYSRTPFDVQLNYLLALKWGETKNPKVIALCDSLIRADSMGIHAEPYYYKGIYFSNIGNTAKAIALFDDAIRHDYYFLDAYIEKGALLFDQKKYADAFQVFNLAMTISPKFADAYYWMARCQEAMGNKAEARANYLRAFGLDKNLVEASRGAERLK